jgi:hypothetical protein
MPQNRSKLILPTIAAAGLVVTLVGISFFKKSNQDVRKFQGAATATTLSTPDSTTQTSSGERFTLTSP